MTAWTGAVAVEMLRSGQILAIFYRKKTQDLLSYVIQDVRQRERRVMGDFKEFWPEQLGIEEDCDRSRFGHLKFEMPNGTSRWKYVSSSIILVSIK